MLTDKQKRWIKYQRSAYYDETISVHIIKKLENLPKWKWIRKSSKHPSFKAARQFVRSLKFVSKYQWFKYCRNGKNPYPHIKSLASRQYESEWISWPDFLGTKPGWTGITITTYNASDL